MDHRDGHDLMDLGSVSVHLQMNPVRVEGALEANKCQLICRENNK